MKRRLRSDKKPTHSQSPHQNRDYFHNLRPAYQTYNKDDRGRILYRSKPPRQVNAASHSLPRNGKKQAQRPVAGTHKNKGLLTTVKSGQQTPHPKDSVARRLGSMIASMNKAKTEGRSKGRSSSPAQKLKIGQNGRKRSISSFVNKGQISIRKHKGSSESFEKQLADRSLVRRLSRVRVSADVSVAKLDRDYQQHRVHVHLRGNYLHASGVRHCTRLK